MQELVRILRSEEGQDIAEYAVMLAVILVLVVGTIRLVGSNANNVFSQVGSSLNQWPKTRVQQVIWLDTGEESMA